MGQFVGCDRGHRARPAWRSTSRSCRATSRSTTRPTAGRSCPRPTIGGVGVIDDVARAVASPLKQRGRGDRPDRRDRRPGSASRSICARSAAARKARRRRSISPSNGAMATSCARRSPATCQRLPRRLGRRPAGGPGRNGAGRRNRGLDRAAGGTSLRSHAFLLRRGSGPLPGHRRRTRRTSAARRGRGGGRSGR